MTEEHPLQATILGVGVFGLLIGISGGLLADCFQDQFQGNAKPIAQLSGALVCLLLSVLLAWRLNPRVQALFQPSNALLSIGHYIKDLTNVQPAQALIALVSKGQGSNSARDAAYYHRSRLSYLWLVCTTESRADAEAIRAELTGSSDFPSLKEVFVEELTDVNQVSATYNQLLSFRATAIGRYGLAEEDLICDLTGLSKPASAAMTLLCAPPRRRLQYMTAQAMDEHMRALNTPGAIRSQPTEIRIAFEVIEDK